MKHASEIYHRRSKKTDYDIVLEKVNERINVFFKFSYNQLSKNTQVEMLKPDVMDNEVSASEAIARIK